MHKNRIISFFYHTRRTPPKIYEHLCLYQGIHASIPLKIQQSYKAHQDCKGTVCLILKSHYSKKF